jgi:hypothetical protein
MTTPRGLGSWIGTGTFRDQGTLIAGSGAVGFGTKCCGMPRTIAEIVAKVMMVIASARIAGV